MMKVTKSSSIFLAFLMMRKTKGKTYEQIKEDIQPKSLIM